MSKRIEGGIMKSWLKLVCIYMLIPALALAQNKQLTSAELSELDKYITRSMQDFEIPGLGLAIVKDDKIIVSKGYGVREMGKTGKVDENTLFAVASHSKAFTAAALGMLVEEGRLGWYDRVTDYLPQFHMHDPWVTREMRVIDLLTHRSGLPTYGGDHLWIGQRLSPQEMIRRIRHLKPSESFRSTYQYQNLMYLVAGELIPAITGVSWDDFIRERILKPLGMNRSNTSITAFGDDPNVAQPHEPVDGVLKAVPYDFLDNIAPAAALNSSAKDMAQWVRLNLNSGEFESRRILKKETVDMMQRGHMIAYSGFYERVFGVNFKEYGLGWGLMDYKGYKVVTHSGGMTGMISLTVMIPSEKFGVTVLTNHSVSNIRPVAFRVLDAYLDNSDRDWSAEWLERSKALIKSDKMAEAKLQASRAKDSSPSHKLASYTGTYYNDFSGEATVTLQDGKLFFYYNERHKGFLEHWHFDTFRLHWIVPIFDMEPKTFLTFRLDETGKVVSLETKYYHPIDFTRISPEVKQ